MTISSNNSAIGASFARPQAKRLLTGRGRYSSDLMLPRMLHLAFLRSPYAHAEIRTIEVQAAQQMPGVVAVFTWQELAAVCQPMQTHLVHMPQHRSAVQTPLADKKAVWQGEPVVAIIAEQRAIAEDAAELIQIDWQPLPARHNPQEALIAAAIHEKLPDNLAFSLQREAGQNVNGDSITVSREFDFARITGVPLESRCLIADYNPAEDSLTVYHSHQAPHLMQAMFARHLTIQEHQVRVISNDVGGAFGVKLHVYGDELAVAASARLLGRPVKFVADRLESFLSDIHAREFQVTATLCADSAGNLQNLHTRLLGAIGAYSIYPRSSIGDGIQGLTLAGAPYRLPTLSGELKLVYQNKPATGAYRGVGQPIACAITELLLDDLAAELTIDPITLRQRVYLKDSDYPHTTAGGLQLPELSLQQCLQLLCERMNYQQLREQQTRLRQNSIYRGIGVATFIEQSALGANLYGPSGQPLTAQDYSRVQLEPSGVVRCEVGCTDQGQGTLTGIGQIIADTLGISFEQVAVKAGDSAGPYGGGAWASRGLTISGEATFLAARELRQRVLTIAAALLQTKAADLDLQNGEIVDKVSQQVRTTVQNVCHLAYFQQYLLPPDLNLDLSVTRSFVPRDPPYFVANGVQASYLEIDTDTGFIRLLNHWVVEDCGRIINPQLVDEQLRGAIVQGLGAALFEQCIYDEDAQLCNGTLADYLVPMAGEMPDIDVSHIETPASGTELGVKGAGEAGIIGAAAAVWCAVNDALRPLGANVTRQPFTPEVILQVLGKL